MKRILSVFLSLVFMMSSVFVISPSVFAQEMQTASQTETSTAEVSSFPSKYDPRETGMVSPIKDQYSSNNCWAFGSAAAIDQALIKQGLVTDPSSLNVTGKSLAYTFFARRDDPLHNTSGDINRPYGTYDKSGVYSRSVAFFLSTWLGIMIYEDYPDWSLTPTIMDSALDYSAVKYRVKNCHFYNSPSIEEVKSAVTKYGALEVTMEVGSMQDSQVVYYNSGGGLLHSVCVVGWDDTVAKENFSPVPSQDGAWIIKDSWGTAAHDKGYLYVSYDSGLSSGKAFEIMTSDEYDNNYFYDGSVGDGLTDTLFFGESTNHESVANVFEAQKESDTEAEYLKAVNIAFAGESKDGIEITVKIYTDVNLDSSNPENGTLVHTQTETFERGGVYTIDLDKAIELKKGKKFSAVMELDAGDGVVSTYLSHSSSIGGGSYAHEETNPDQSFLLRGSEEWQDLYGVVNNHEGNRVARVKAFTVTEEKTAKNYMVDALGGSIRVNGTPGLRFGFSYDKTQLEGTESIEEYGFLYSYSQTDNLTFGTNGVKQIAANNRVDHGDYVTYNLVFTNIPSSAFDQVLSARAYIKIDGEYYYSDILQRSFRGVADAVLADDEISQTIKDRINQILNEGM